MQRRDGGEAIDGARQTAPAGPVAVAVANRSVRSYAPRK
jgi:hypothetical protein